MSDTNLYQLYDTEAGCVAGPIIIERKHAPAIRMFIDVIADPKTTPGQYPHHFELRWIGTVELDTGWLTPNQPPVVIYTGQEWLIDRERKDTLRPEAEKSLELGR
jgi:hypothetical protein